MGGGGVRLTAKTPPRSPPVGPAAQCTGCRRSRWSAPGVPYLEVRRPRVRVPRRLGRAPGGDGSRAPRGGSGLHSRRTPGPRCRSASDPALQRPGPTRPRRPGPFAETGRSPAGRCASRQTRARARLLPVRRPGAPTPRPFRLPHPPARPSRLCRQAGDPRRRLNHLPSTATTGSRPRATVLGPAPGPLPPLLSLN